MKIAVQEYMHFYIHFIYETSPSFSRISFKLESEPIGDADAFAFIPVAAECFPKSRGIELCFRNILKVI